MQLNLLDFDLTVCQVENVQQLNLQQDFFFIGRTEKEISLVCKTADVPERTLRREDGWRGFYIAGALDFSLVGILAGITGLLAEKRISIFALSTYDTDYVLVKKERFQDALSLLRQNGYTIAG